MSTTIEEMRTVLPGYYNVRFGEPEYTDWMDESMSWKQTCYIGDWSFLWQRWFRGPDALKLFSDISVNSFAKFEIGQSKHAIHCNNAGKIIHEGILSRFGEQEFLLFGRGCFWADYRLRHGSYDATSEADDWFVYQVSGPKSLPLMEKLLGESLRDVGFMRFRKIGLPATTFTRCGRAWRARSASSFRGRGRGGRPSTTLSTQPAESLAFAGWVPASPRSTIWRPATQLS